MEPDGDPPPFWSPSTATILRQQRHRRRAPPQILSPVSLILLLPILALLIIFFLLPPFLSHTSQLLRPTYSVKKSWDSFNILLVVFAILCGVFSRRNAEEEAPGGGDDGSGAEAPATEVDVSDHQVSFTDAAGTADRNIVEDEAVRVSRWFDGGGGGGNRLRRSSSSYPDLRQQDLAWGTGDSRYRFYDDIDVDLYRRTEPVVLNRRARRDEGGARVIPVDTFEVRSTRPPSPDPPPKAPTPPPPPPPPPRKSLHSVPRKQKVEKVLDENRSAPPPQSSKPKQLRRRYREAERIRFESSKVTVETEIAEIAASLPEDPPPPPSPPRVVEVERFSERRLQRKKSGAKELATAIASLYTDRKRKKKLKRKNISESSGESSPTNVLPYIPPPPPPPPPPVKAFQNLFKKSTKHKRVHSVAATAPPPPPPPPPPSSIFNNIFKTGKSKRFSNINTPASLNPPPPPPPPPPSSILNTIFKQGNKSRRHKYETRAPPHEFSNTNSSNPPPVQFNRKSRTNQAEPSPEQSRRRTTQASWKPPLPAKPNSYYEEYLDNSGAQSPLVPLPPPPPPPFKMPDFKFVARGDFVRILSAHSSRCSSPERPDLEDVEVMSVKSSEGGSGSGPGPSGFCPSPDVNLKADSFIARLKGEWRMDKMNSL